MSRKVCVIGAGPGGYVAAIRLAQQGSEVTLIEREHIGGVCLNVGCIPSKALINVSQEHSKLQKDRTNIGLQNVSGELDFSQTQKWKTNTVINPLVSGIEYILKKNKVSVLNGNATFKNSKQVIVENKDKQTIVDFDNAVIATGSRNIEIPGFAIEGNIIDSTKALDLEEVPKNLVVIGGGYIGTELANIYANLGSKVVILEGSDRILSGFDNDMSDIVSDYLMKEKGITIISNALAKSHKDKDNVVEVTYEKDGIEHNIVTDKVLVSVGRRPNSESLNLKEIGVELLPSNHIKVNEYLQTTQKNIYAIGDVIKGPALAHKASYEGKYVADQINKEKYRYPNVNVPAVCYTDIELSSVGLMLKDIEDNKADYIVSDFPWVGNGRSLATGNPKGFVRVIANKDNHQVVGAQVVGNQAGEIITQLTLAVETQLVLEDIALTIHPHPSYSEAVMEAVDLGLGFPTHI